MKEIINEIQNLYKKYDNCDHLEYPEGISSPNHCIGMLETELYRVIEHYKLMMNK